MKIKWFLQRGLDKAETILASMVLIYNIYIF